MVDEKYVPLIVGFVADLLFMTRIESQVEALGYRVAWIESLEQVASSSLEGSDRQFGEHLSGPGAVLLDSLTRWHPVLIIIDLGNGAIPWREWLALIKSVPATRRIPVICYGPHVEVQAFAEARNRGADAVLARSRFLKELPRLVQTHARLPDRAALQAACQQPLSGEALHGLALFNQGEYFEAHEALEQAWNLDLTPGRELYRAILQVAVAYLQIERANYNGAVKMFLRVRQWIDPLPNCCRGVDVEKLRTDARQVHQVVLDLGPAGLSRFDRGLFQPVVYCEGS